VQNIEKLRIYIYMAAAAAEIFINCLRQRRRLENLSKFSVIGGWIFFEKTGGGGGSASRLTPLCIWQYDK
jgi:hypothetical protein